MDEQKREEIRKGAKKILDDFASALEKVEFKRKALKEGIGGFRKEESGKDRHDADFRKRIFENAPSKDEDCIIAEKKEWA